MKKRLYPPTAEEGTNPNPGFQQQQPVPQPSQTTQSTFGNQPLAQTTPSPFGYQAQPFQPQTSSQTFQTPAPSPSPAFPAPSYQAPTYQPSTPTPTTPEPSFGLTTAPPLASSQVASQPTQSAQPQMITKHKRVFAVDPEDFSSTEQLSSSMGQMNLGAQPTGQPHMYNPGGVTAAPAQQQQNYPITSGSAAEEPVNVTPAVQCPPTYMRMSFNVVPDSSNLLNKCNIPFGAVIHPMAESGRPEDEIPVLNFGVSGILRCRRCRAYINPFVTFTDAGRRWRCNLCTLANDVPGDYFSPVDRNGRRTDIDQRPELTKGAVEFIAPSEYMVRPPQPPSYIFVIDVGYYSITSGMFHTCINTIQSILNNFPGDSRARLGFITYDNTVHFYNLKATLSQPQILVVTDIDDIFVPLPDDLLVNLADSRTIVETLLSKFGGMFQNTQIVDSVAGVALKAAYNIIKNIGGKVLLFANTIPTLGVGKLPNRDDPKLLGTDKEVNLLLADDQYYKDFALDCSRQQISVDTFLFSAQFIDVATLGCMPQFTGGQLYYYPAFRADKDAPKFQKDLIRNITRETGWEAVMRVRCSKGLKVTSHYGNFFIRSTDLLALPSVDADKAFAVQFAHSDGNVATKYVSIQAALLYTTSGGERRIRVFTQCLPVTSSMAEIFKVADVEAVTAITTKMAIEKALSSKLLDAREALVNKCIDILAVYRNDVVGSAGGAQLMLPEALKALPLFVLALVKNVMFRAVTDIKPDERTYFMMLARILPIPLLSRFIYPRLFALHTLPPEVGTKDQYGATILPQPLNLSSERLDRKGVFLLDDGNIMYLWIGKEVSPDFLVQLLGIPSVDNVDTTQLALPLLNSDISIRVNGIVAELQNQSPTLQNLYIIKEGEPRELRWFNYFVEDRTKSVHSYYEFLVNLHQRVQAKSTRK